MVLSLVILSVTCSHRTDTNCLLNDPADVAMNITEHPGQRYSVDKQCQIIYGPESFYCGVSLLRTFTAYNNLLNV